jgi:hypothetical protein
VRRLASAFTAEFSVKHEYAHADTREWIQVEAHDSQRRQLLEFRKPNGRIDATVQDPVAGTRIVWNSVSNQAKVLKYPTPAAGRTMCWRTDDEKYSTGSDDPQIGTYTSRLPPAPEPPPSSCHDERAAELVVDAVPAPKPGFPNCDPAEPGGIAEDLGMELIHSVTAHGCRSTTPHPSGRKLRETWSDDYGLPVRLIEEDPNGAKVFWELLSLDRNEPALSVFRPPHGYEIVSVEVHEVPCADSARPPKGH